MARWSETAVEIKVGSALSDREIRQAFGPRGTNMTGLGPRQLP